MSKQEKWEAFDCRPDAISSVCDEWMASADDHILKADARIAELEAENERLRKLSQLSPKAKHGTNQHTKGCTEKNSVQPTQPPELGALQRMVKNAGNADYQQGVEDGSGGGGNSLKSRFRILLRDAPKVAQDVLKAKYIKTLKNGEKRLDMAAAEKVAGVHRPPPSVKKTPAQKAAAALGNLNKTEMRGMLKELTPATRRRLREIVRELPAKYRPAYLTSKIDDDTHHW